MNDLLPFKSKPYLRTLNILFAGLLGGQIIIVLIFSLLVATEEPAAIIPANIQLVFLWLVPGLAVMAVLMAWQVFQLKMKTLQDKNSLPEKLQGYQAALLLRYAIMEGPGLFAAVVFYLTGQYIFLIVAAFIIVVFLLNRPSVTKIIQHLKLHDDERMMLEDPGN